MTEKQLDRKVSVFISSKCDNNEEVKRGMLKYGIIRKSLKLLLEETNMCKVYVFEKGTGTSYDVVHSYMNYLDDCDLVIVLVDNKDGVTPATQEEINRAKALHKKCIYIFCDQYENKATELQEQLQSDTTNPRFSIAHEFSNMPEIAYKAVVNDILQLYISYCKGRADYNSLDSNQLETDDNSIFNVSKFKENSVTKESLKGYSFTKYLVKKEANIAFEKVHSEPGVDFNCACLEGLVIGSLMTEMPDFSNIKSDIRQLHTGDLQKLVLLRYDAIEEYFSGNLQKCIELLSKCYDCYSSSKEIPKWLLNDVAIDLRNIEVELDRENDVTNFDFKGQKILDQDLTPLYYPVLDRIVADYNGDILECQLKDLIQSPYTVNIGGVDCILDKATNAFLVAYQYGSLSHLLLHRKRLYEYLAIMSYTVKDHKMFIFVIKLLLLTNDEKMLKQFWTSYGENTNSINNKDIEYLRRGIEKQKIEYRNVVARILLLKYFGYYYSDEQFKEETEFLFNRVEKYIIDKKATSLVIKPMLGAIEENMARCEEHFSLNYIYMLFQHGCKRYYNDAFKFLFNFRFRNLDDAEQTRYQKFIVKCIRDEDIRKNCHDIFWAAQTLRQCETISHEFLDEAVKESNKTFYEETYLLNVENHNIKTSWKYVRQYMDMIHSANESQGRNGAYYGYSVNPYITIANIVKADHVKFTSKQFKQLLDCIYGTLFAGLQTIDAKIDAIELLCVLQITHLRNKQIKELVNKIEFNWQKVVTAKEIFLTKGYSTENLNLSFNILKSCVGLENAENLLLSFVQMQNCDVACKINMIAMVKRLFDIDCWTILNDSEKGYFFQYIMNASYSNNCDERFMAMSVLIKLLGSKYRQMCLTRLVEMIDTEPYKNKVGMLYRLKETDTQDSKIQYIFDKGIADSHYWVRKVALER